MTAPSRLLPSVVLKTPRYKRLLHFFGFNTGGDSNMRLAHEAGIWLCNHGYDALSRSIWESARLAEKVEECVLGPIMRGEDVRFARDAERLLGMDRCEAGVALRTWAGCMSGAKCIALGTRNGRNWPWWRRRQAKAMEMECARDPVFQMGVMAAIAFKIGRNEAYSLFGVPSDHYLRIGEVAVKGSREPARKATINHDGTPRNPGAN